MVFIMYRKNKFKKKKNPYRKNQTLQDRLAYTQKVSALEDKLDQVFGYTPIPSGVKKLGFLLNIAPTTVQDRETGIPKSAINLYYLQADGECFKCSVPYEVSQHCVLDSAVNQRKCPMSKSTVIVDISTR